ncbi:hypothetical protein IQ07DRAFT_76754 [Pyrenochaeta sp. DS3sAY3a]|nr:hypothetical protein IQ07DRAFT_76754 [Pyrenochaeta sp. DS3sAY3a]
MVDSSTVRGAPALLHFALSPSSLAYAQSPHATTPSQWNSRLLHLKPIFLQPISIPAVKRSTDSQTSGCKILPARRSFAQLVNLQASLQATLPSDVQPGTTLRPTARVPAAYRQTGTATCLPACSHSLIRRPGFPAQQSNRSQPRGSG